VKNELAFMVIVFGIIDFDGFLRSQQIIESNIHQYPISSIIQFVSNLYTIFILL